MNQALRFSSAYVTSMEVTATNPNTVSLSMLPAKGAAARETSIPLPLGDLELALFFQGPEELDELRRVDREKFRADCVPDLENRALSVRELASLVRSAAR